jgi:hypothetical protein
MELKDFLKNVISSIANGIIEAQIELSDIGIIIYPEKLEIGKSGEKLLRADGWRYTQELDFEILVSIDEKNTEGGDGKLTVLNFASLGLNSINETNVSNSNKLKFKIPVAFPTTKTPDEYRPKGTSIL